jgi:RNA polymerase sigma factor (TIGR02999 family)
MSDSRPILSAIEQGNSHAADALLPLVHDELRKLATQKLAQEQPGQALQAIALVHEAYMRLVAGSKQAAGQSGDSRGHFFAAAAEAMRRILINQARTGRGLRGTRPAATPRHLLGPNLHPTREDSYEADCIENCIRRLRKKRHSVTVLQRDVTDGRSNHRPAAEF